MKFSRIIALALASFVQQAANAQSPCLVDFFGEFTINANRIVAIQACDSRSNCSAPQVVIVTDGRRVASKSTSLRDAELRVVAFKEMVRQQCGAK